MRHKLMQCATVATLLAGCLAASGADGTAKNPREVTPIGVDARPIEYRDGDVTLKGYIACDSSVAEKRPGILVVHEWWGLNDYARWRARQLAAMGYVALAVDMYGDGRTADSPEAAGRLAGSVKADRDLMRRRMAAALAALKSDPRVDPDRTAAIGYCFGGTCVLELARSGAEVKGVVSFHGGLDTPDPEKTARPEVRILVCHGAADPHVAPAEVNAFREEMNRCGADWQLNMYGEAVHAFTNPDAGNDPSKGAAYNAVADQRSWADMTAFLGEVLR